MTMNLTIHIDGGARGNPGPAAIGIAIRDADSDKPIHEAGYVLGKATNNVAEYTGLVRAVDLALEMGAGDVRIFSDSELLVKQLTGEYRVKNAALGELLEQAQFGLLKLNSWAIRHVPRKENKRADELVNMALDAGEDVIAIADGQVMDVPRPAAGRGGSASGSARHADGQAEASAAGNEPCVSVHIQKKPGKVCPMANMARRFDVGPATPADMCVHAAQAVFDEHITLWKEIGRDDAQTQCAKCGVGISIAVK